MQSSYECTYFSNTNDIKYRKMLTSYQLLKMYKWLQHILKVIKLFLQMKLELMV